MSETTRLTNEYIEITKQDIEAHERTAKEANEYIRNSTAQYHGRCVKALYVPKILPDGRSGYSPIWSVRCVAFFIRLWMPMQKTKIIGGFLDSSRS